MNGVNGIRGEHGDLVVFLGYVPVVVEHALVVGDQPLASPNVEEVGLVPWDVEG